MNSKNGQVLRYIGFIALGYFITALFGSVHRLFVFRYYGVSAFADLASASGSAILSVGMAALTGMPLLFVVYPTSKTQRFFNNKWMYFAVTIPVALLYCTFSDIYSSSQMGMYLAVGTVPLLLLTSIKLAETTTRKRFAMFVILVHALIFTSTDISASTWLRDTFPIVNLDEEVYAHIMSDGRNMYWSPCEIVEDDSEIHIVIKNDDTMVIKRLNAEDYWEKNGLSTENVKVQKVIIR